MTAQSPAATGANYEVLSRDTVKQMHDKFMAGVEEKAKKAVPATVKNPEEVVESLMTLLIAAAHKAIEIKTDELAGLAGGGKEAVAKRTEEVQGKLHAKLPETSYPSPKFSEGQKEELARAARARRDIDVVKEVFGNEDRIYLRLTGKVDAPVSDTQTAIAKFLADRGYQITDYKKGYATDEKGKQQFRIGKLLKENADLYQGFMDDSTRTLGTLFAVISRNAEDIAHMSTGRAWASCMGSGGFNYKYVPKEIREGSLIAYMVSEKDPDIVNPLARILIKPFRKDEFKLTTWARAVFGRTPERIFVPDKTYGIPNATFREVVQTFVEEKLNHGKHGKFRIVQGIYQDGVAAQQIRKNEKTVAGRMYMY